MLYNVVKGEIDMANRPKTARNDRILRLWESGWRQKSIANMLKMKESAVSMVILRAKQKGETKGGNK